MPKFLFEGRLFQTTVPNASEIPFVWSSCPPSTEFHSGDTSAPVRHGCRKVTLYSISFTRDWPATWICTFSVRLGFTAEHSAPHNDYAREPNLSSSRSEPPGRSRPLRHPHKGRASVHCHQRGSSSTAFNAHILPPTSFIHPLATHRSDHHPVSLYLDIASALPLAGGGLMEPTVSHNRLCNPATAETVVFVHSFCNPTVTAMFLCSIQSAGLTDNVCNLESLWMTDIKSNYGAGFHLQSSSGRLGRKTFPLFPLLFFTASGRLFCLVICLGWPTSSFPPLDLRELLAFVHFLADFA
ncbi:unnamed protein product [Protopolystoma xenopodis]|uniref:Uncharacterized protein n=1 Tax=Protopolystoma xenopodis TaxID=117903 RepID=A0A448WLI1_9PLAT|nr:unnamed protein product [Protopolystoma xenopodis]